MDVVPGLIARPHGRDGSAGMSVVGRERERFLGDYVSRDKMMAVKDGCAKVLTDIKTRSEALETILAEVLAGTALVKTEFEDTSRDLEDLELCEADADADQGHVRIEELVRTGEEQLASIDFDARDRIRFLVGLERKNAMTRYLILSMQRISNLQSDIASMPENLGALDHDLRVKTDNFKHLARLEGLIPAYVATVVEVVRRREFGRLLEDHSQSVAQSLSHLSSTERTRRTTYRSTFSGKLPWEVKGLGAGTDDVLPAFDVGGNFGTDELPDLGREVLDGQSTAPFVAPGTSTVEELYEQIRTLEESKEELERQLQSERSGRKEELTQLNQRNGELTAARERDGNSLTSLREQGVKNDVDRRKWESDRALWNQERREGTEKLEGVENRALKATDDLARPTTKASELERQLEASRSSSDELSRSDHDNLQWELSRARTTIQELEEQTHAFQVTIRELNGALADKERLLRDQRGESELDRAVLEKEMADLHCIVDSKEAQLVVSSERASALEEVVNGLREQIGRWEVISGAKENEVGVAKSDAEEARREREVGIVAVQRQLVVATAIARAALKFAGDIRAENNKIASVLSAPTPTKSDSSTDNVDKAVINITALELARKDVSAIVAEPGPTLDYAEGDLDDLLAEVQKYDRDALTDEVKAKIEGLTSISKKWSKEAKAYRERAHRAASEASDKIAFRNFTKGDLALFLPTRNLTVPVLAAFNVSFPHHSLSATGIISEQMKSREWIVARITNLTEKAADVKRSITPLSAAELLNCPRRPSFCTHVSPSIRRTASTPIGLPSNATDLARTEFAIVEEDYPAESSALALALARSPPLHHSSLPRSDPFSDAPFPGSPPSPDLAEITPPPTDFEPTNTPAGAVPAFLPSGRKASAHAGSEAGSSSRYIVQRSPKPKVELGSSPASTTGGSFVNFSRSASPGSSILSASMHRRGTSAQPGSSPPVLPKALSTTEAQEPGSRWTSLTQDLASATTEDFPINPLVRSTMTIGRNTRGWPSTAPGSTPVERVGIGMAELDVKLDVQARELTIAKADLNLVKKDQVDILKSLRASVSLEKEALTKEVEKLRSATQAADDKAKMQMSQINSLLMEKVSLQSDGIGQREKMLQRECDVGCSCRIATPSTRKRHSTLYQHFYTR
ncbi:autophagy-related protein 11, partial [Phenoliferia sp. Uapishka_3]